MSGYRMSDSAPLYALIIALGGLSAVGALFMLAIHWVLS